MNNKITPIDQILDLEQDQPPNNNKPPQFPNVNPNYQEQLNQEANDRDLMLPMLKSKVRQHSSSNMRDAMNGGDHIQRYFQEQPFMYSDPPMLSYDQPIFQQQPQMMIPPQIHCLDIVTHIKDCPLCSKFHANDRVTYLITILLLLIIISILVKKLIDR